MTNEIKVEAQTTTEDVSKEVALEAESTESKETKETETKETERQEETAEAKKSRLQGSMKRMAKDLEDLGIDPSSLFTAKAEPKKASKKSGDLDYAEKSFLISNGIKLDELGFAQDLVKKTGMSLDEFVTDDYAQAKLKSFREAKTTSQAIPQGTKRSSGNTKDSVEYNLERYENGAIQLKDLPFDMRSKVLTAKVEKEKKSSQFSFTPSA